MLSRDHNILWLPESNGYPTSACGLLSAFRPPGQSRPAVSRSRKRLLRGKIGTVAMGRSHGHTAVTNDSNQTDGDFLFAGRLVPLGRKGNIVYARSLRPGEEDTGEGVHVKQALVGRNANGVLYSAFLRSLINFRLGKGRIAPEGDLLARSLLALPSGRREVVER